MFTAKCIKSYGKDKDILVVIIKEKYGSGTRKTFDRFTTKDSYTWNITHNTESTAV